MPDPADPKAYKPKPFDLTGRESPRHRYAELDVTTNFSFLIGASHPDELVNQAAFLGCAAIAVTDINTLAGVVRAHHAAKEVGLPLIVGARLRFTDASDVLVWVRDKASYGRLSRLITLGRRRAVKGECNLSLDDLIAHADGMWAAMVCGNAPEHDLTRAGRKLRDTFDKRFSLAVCRDLSGEPTQTFERHQQLGKQLHTPLLATNGVQFHHPDRRPLHDIVTCIRHRCSVHDAGFRLRGNAERYLKPPDDMHWLFVDQPQLIHRGLEIAEACRDFSLDAIRYEYPSEFVPKGLTPLVYLEKLARDGAKVRYPGGVPTKVEELIRRELTLIEQEKFESYFLTINDIVCYARSQGILCQGRGSAANSVVCYCLGVTCVDPDRIEVLFERFISGARQEPPDIDIDFEHERREEVIQYVYEKYGRDRAGMTATVICYRGRSVIRDVGKALAFSPDTLDAIASRLDWWDHGRPSDEDLAAAGLNGQDADVKRLIDRAGELLGFPRHLSQHTGGMVMTQGHLCEIVPIENASMKHRTVIEWDKDDIDELKIMKVDLLGLGMLTCIAKCLRLINATRDVPLELYTIPSEDPLVYEMISDADTVGVFQVESRAQMTMLPRLRPKRFYDLVIEVAIVRPGPIQGDMVHPYLTRRLSSAPVKYPSREIEEILKRTLGVPLFQEQAMKLVMVAAGFTGKDADQLRRAMAAWKKDGSIERFQERIIHGMVRRGYSQKLAEGVYEQVKGFGSYGFPESHAASFAALVYASAWIKRYHPAAFACGLLNSLPMGFYAAPQLVRDAINHGVDVRPVDVNASEWESTLEYENRATPSPLPVLRGRVREGASPNVDGRSAPSLTLPRKYAGEGTGKEHWGVNGPALRLGFDRIKGMNEKSAREIMAERAARGPFASPNDLRVRTGLPWHVLRLLARAGAFNSIVDGRRAAVWETIEHVETPAADTSLAEAMPAVAAPSTEFLPDESAYQSLLADHRTIGFSPGRHPMSLLRPRLTREGVITSAQLKDISDGRRVKVAGVVIIRQRPGTAQGLVFMTMEDELGMINLVVFPDVYTRYRNIARGEPLLEAIGKVQRQGQVIHVVAEQFRDKGKLLRAFDFESRNFR